MRVPEHQNGTEGDRLLLRQSVQVRSILQVQGGVDGRGMPRIALGPAPAIFGPMRGIYETLKGVNHAQLFQRSSRCR